jgi:hypothetical protein
MQLIKEYFQCSEKIQKSSVFLIRNDLRYPIMNKKFTFPMVVIVFILNLNHCTKFQESDFDSNSTLSNLLLFNRFSQGFTLTISPEPGHYTTSQIITMSAHSAAKNLFYD